MEVGHRLAYSLYERRLAREIPRDRVPRHVGVVLDGNRRWARTAGEEPVEGHRQGAARIVDFLGWCEEAGVEVVTLWLLSTENLERPREELDPLLEIIDSTIAGLAATGRWRLHPVGALDLLPEATAAVLRAAAEGTVDVEGLLVNVAVGYGGRTEIIDAVRSYLAECAEQGMTIDEAAKGLDVEAVADHLYTAGQPDPDLVIRTSGEQRMSGFLLWQSAHSEFYFEDAYWPDYRRVDLLRALRSYAARQRRFGV